MLTTDEITKLLAPPAPGVTAASGRAMYLARRENKSLNSTPAQRQLLSDLASGGSHLENTAPLPAKYNHPAASAVLAHRDPGPLSPVEQQWLSTIPTDPSSVPFDDARTLAGLAEAVSPTRHPIDAKLVAAKWDPVRDFHDRQAAHIDLVRAAAPLRPIPPSALSALADAVQQENPGLNPQEALGRANRLLDEVSAKRMFAQESRKVDAEDRLSTIDNAVAKRRSWASA